MSEEVEVLELPDCQMDHAQPVLARYDARTTLGPWAYLCEAHFQEYGVGLGTGNGQKLRLRAGQQ